MSIFDTIGRMFTVPAKVRKQLDANKTVQEAKAALLPSLITSLGATVDDKVQDPLAALLIKTEIAHLIQSSGIAK